MSPSNRLDEGIIEAGPGEIYEDLLSRSWEREAARVSGEEASSYPEIFGGISGSRNIDGEMREQTLLYGAMVPRNSHARRLLSRLYEKKILGISDIGPECRWTDGVALAQLAAAQFCDVDMYGIRITDRGAAFVERLLELAKE